MMRFSAILVILLVNRKLVASAPMCPIGDVGNYQMCLPEKPRYLSEGEVLCCPNELACTDYNMNAFYFAEYKDEKLIFATVLKDIKSEITPQDVKLYTEQRTGDDGRNLLCPIPVNYLYYDAKIIKPREQIHEQFLPVKNSDGKYKTCTKNGDCQKSTYCGNAINFAVNRNFEKVCEEDPKKFCTVDTGCRKKCMVNQKTWLNVEPTVKFCYHIPKPMNENNDRMTNIQIQIRAELTGFKICDEHNECQLGNEKGWCYKGNLGQGSKKWTMFNDTTSPGERLHKNGICTEGKPISFTLYKQFKTLSDAEKLGDKGLKFMAVDWAKKDYLYRDEMKRCEMNKDCAEDEFCDNIFHPDGDGDAQKGFDKDNKFCFKKPDQPANANSPVIFTAPGHLVGLVPCAENADCKKHGTDGNSFCQNLGENKWKFQRFADGKVNDYDGLCLEGVICTTPNRFGEEFKWKVGGNPPSYSCTKNEECKDGGNTKDAENVKEVFEDVCIRSKPFNHMSSCCYRQTKRCPGQNSKVIFPDKRCGKNATATKLDAFTECYGTRDAMLAASKRDKWCDFDTNQCCQDSSADALCPDGQVPLYAEPECEGYNATKPGSGNCGMNVCKLGHCCAKASIENGKVVKPDRCYITAQPCTPGIQPAQFSAGYCDPKSQKIVIIGLKSPKGHPLQKSPATPKSCQKDTDCSSDSSVLCLRENSVDPQAYCYLNPLNEPAEKEEDSSTKTIIIIVVVVVILVILLGGIGGALYFLKKKKGGGKGKGKGGKKGDKKGGKDDKKKKGGKGSKPKSKPKSKTKSKSKSKSKTPETGSKETGTIEKTGEV